MHICHLHLCSHWAWDLGGKVASLWSGQNRRSAHTLTPATLAGGKLSFSALVNAFSSTRLQADSLRKEARLPRSMVVFALMAGSSSTCRKHDT